MNTNESIEIPLSKGKLSLMLIGSIAFVGIGFWLIIKRPVFAMPVLGNPVVVLIAGIAAIALFGLCVILFLKKLSDDRPGLIINAEGITDNSSGISAGLIVWPDIQSITKTNVFNQSFIIIVVNNPDYYINRQSGMLIRKTMKLNYKSYGSPICISSNSLKYNFNDLYSLIENKFRNEKLKP